jgi:4-hydroxybenzoate polyprenyltransferase
VTTSTAARTGTAVALVGASHPLPSLAVTAFATAVAAAAGRSAAGCVLVAGAVGAGQLSIGWSNDLIDRARDRAAGRRDKPLAVGAVPPRVVGTACALAVVCCIPLSMASGWRAGTAHLLAVAGGWAYNLRLKRTVLSFLPYAVSFALLTAFLTLGLPGSPWPPPWALAAGALLGVGAHFLNVVPDVDDDLAAGVLGLPQRLGARRSAVLGAALLCAAAALVVLGPGRPVPAWAWAGLAVAVGTAAAAGAAGLRRTAGRSPFLLAVATAAVAVGLLLARGSALT